MSLLKSRASRQEKASACNWNGAATDEHILHDAVLERRLDVDAAGTEHLDSLLEHDRLLAGGEAMLYKIRDGATGGGPGGGIFPVVELHARVPICTGACIGASDAVEEFCVGLFEVRAGCWLWDCKARGDGERTQRHDAEGHASGDGLNGQRRIEVVYGEIECGGDLCVVVNDAEGGVVLSHSAEDPMLAGVRRREADGDGANSEVEGDGRSAAQDGMVPVKPACGAEGWMTGKFELFLNCEDADVDAAFAFDLGLAGGDEGGLAEVSLAGEGLHLFGREAAGVGEDGEWISGESALGEDVDLGVVESSRWCG
jgi:hypothetical protein